MTNPTAMRELAERLEELATGIQTHSKTIGDYSRVIDERNKVMRQAASHLRALSAPTMTKERIHWLAELAIDHGEGGAQLEIADATLRESLILNVEKQMRRAVTESMALPAPAWADISTAPKDGTHILAYMLPIGIRFTNNTNPPTVVHWFNDEYEPGFYTSVNEREPEFPFRATHWMPLPEPPK